jgi:hypothetical protein
MSTPIEGSVWVQGDYLHFYVQIGNQYYRYLGTPVYINQGTEENPNYVPAVRTNAVVGSVWVDNSPNIGDTGIHYIDSSKIERVILEKVFASPSGINSAIQGSLWIEKNQSNPSTGNFNNVLCSVGGTVSPGLNTKITYHGDSGHGDSVHSDFSDSSHSDTSHSDAYTNHNDVNFWPIFHIDSYLNGGAHGDGSTPSHQDSTEFNDSHSDIPLVYNPNNP